MGTAHNETYIPDYNIAVTNVNGQDLTNNGTEKRKLRPYKNESTFFPINVPAPVIVSLDMKASVLSTLELFTQETSNNIEYEIIISFENGTESYNLNDTVCSFLY
jgi:hypothetical protein